MGDQANPRTGVITFPCGAIYECDYDKGAERVANGRTHLMVLDAQAPKQPCSPQHENGEPAACRKCTSPKHRWTLEQRGFGADPFACRVSVMCSGVLTRKEVSRG